MIEARHIQQSTVEQPGSSQAISDGLPVLDIQRLDSYPIKFVKLDFPRFASQDALQWIFQAEQFFYYYEVPDVFCLKIVVVHLDGSVVPWFQMLQKFGKLTL